MILTISSGSSIVFFRNTLMMRPPHILHPRSKLTSSLFATTLFASFFVVVLPHALPCPAPRVVYADGDEGVDIAGDVDGAQPKRRRRRRKVIVESGPDRRDHAGMIDELDRGIDSGDVKRRAKRECPIPKPPGLVGEILGFKSTGSEEDMSSSGRNGKRPP